MRGVRNFWSDEGGFVVSSELILIATVLVIGVLTGAATIRDQAVQELADVAGAVSDVDESYAYTGTAAHNAATAGSDFEDLLDNCDLDGQNAANPGSNCVDVTAPPSNEGDQGRPGGPDGDLGGQE